MKRLIRLGLTVFACACARTALRAQTAVDLTNQGQLRSGGQLPQSCRTGQMYLLTFNPQWPVLFFCTGGTWSASGLPSLDGDSGGDGKIMHWDATTSRWAASSPADSAGMGIAVTGMILGVDDAIVPMYYVGSGAPAIDCMAGRDFYVDTTAGSLYFCRGSGQWQQTFNSGSLTTAALPAVVVRTDLGNTFSAGLRQSVTHDAANAGLRLVPATGDPASAVDGDLWYNSSTGKFRRRQNGAVSDWDSASGPMYYAGSGAPAMDCVAGRDFYVDTTAGSLYFCRGSGQWQQTFNSSSLTAALPAVVARTDVGNTFSAGLRQSVVHDAANAGLRLVPATGDPASAVDGDLWYNSSTGKFRRRQNGAVSDWDSASSQGGSSLNLLDRSVYWMVEDFPPSGSAATGTQYQGLYRWSLLPIGTNGCSNVAQANGNSNSPGLLALVTSSTASTGCVVALEGSNDNRLTSNLTSKTWYAEWTIVPDLASSSIVARFGVGNSTSTVGSMSAVSCRVDSSSPNYLFDLHTSGALTASADSGVAFVADGGPHTCRIRGDGVKWYFSVASGAGGYSTEKTLCPSGCDLTAALPTFAFSPFASVTTNNTSLKRFYLDRFAMVIQGLSR